MKSFKDIWVSMEPKEKQALAKAVDANKQYLSQIAYGHREPSVALIRRLVDTDPRFHSEMFL